MKCGVRSGRNNEQCFWLLQNTSCYNIHFTPAPQSPQKALNAKSDLTPPLSRLYIMYEFVIPFDVKKL